jgi:hypothetical protein
VMRGHEKKAPRIGSAAPRGFEPSVLLAHIARVGTPRTAATPIRRGSRRLWRTRTSDSDMSG